MTPALRDRLMAERLFTAKDMAEAYAQGAHDALSDDIDGLSFLDDTLARVQTHLSSDTSSIRAKKG